MDELLVGTTLLASFLGGVVALLAPGCVSVMLPAYLATGFRHRGGVVPATLVFGAGVARGASAERRRRTATGAAIAVLTAVRPPDRRRSGTPFRRPRTQSRVKEVSAG